MPVCARSWTAGGDEEGAGEEAEGAGVVGVPAGADDVGVAVAFPGPDGAAVVDGFPPPGWVPAAQSVQKTLCLARPCSPSKVQKSL